MGSKKNKKKKVNSAPSVVNTNSSASTKDAGSAQNAGSAKDAKNAAKAAESVSAKKAKKAANSGKPNVVKEKIRAGAAAFRRIWDKKPFCYSIVQILLLAIVVNLIADSFSRFSFWKAVAFMFVHPLIFLVNTLIIAIFLAPAILFRRRSFF